MVGVVSLFSYFAAGAAVWPPPPPLGTEIGLLTYLVVCFEPQQPIWILD